MLRVDTTALPHPEAQAFEIVERKGLGHPDTLADALAEEFSMALSRYYRDRFGRVLHHNVDKVLVLGGESQPRFGGGVVTRPIEIFFAGRATAAFKGVTVPVETLAIEASRHVLRRTFHALDLDRHVKVHCLARPGSPDLVDLFDRQMREGKWLANDSSIGTGFAPLSRLEKLVLDVDRQLAHPATRALTPAYGEDTKLLAVRQHGETTLTVACAMCDRYLSHAADYAAKKNALAALVASTAGISGDAVTVNAADAPEAGSFYLTVTGTSAEAGDDGQTGRGNRGNGLITPGRPMTLEALAGKNSFSHAGKLYNIVAQHVAEAVILEIPEIRAAECYLVSCIGRPLTEPQLAQVRILTHAGAGPADYTLAIEGIVARHLAELDRLSDQLISGALTIF